MTPVSALSGYSVDTSAMIDGLERYYPPDVFPAVWVKVDELVDAGRFLISEEVYKEACVKDVVTKAWCEEREEKIVVSTDNEIAKEVGRITSSYYPQMAATGRGRDRADPFVVAVGAHRRLVVVTGEVNTGSNTRPKIPYVCQQESVLCISFLAMLRREGFRV